MKKFFVLSLILFLSGLSVSAQESASWENLSQEHPRYINNGKTKKETLRLIKKEAWAQDVLSKLQQRTDPYVAKGTEWLSDRLQMHWNTHATEVYIKGEYYSHCGGEKAPAPTVMLSGARSHATDYARPKLEELQPRQEDARGMWLRNNKLEGKPYEWASISKTGNIIQSINNEIAGIAKNAAFLWWITGETRYAECAASVFDTYMTGIYYRNVPYDLNHGHQQTLMGMQSFEVIHENIIDNLVPLYDFLYDYLKVHKADKMDIYAAAFKKWADNIIDNGVPHNNWNLIQLRFIFNIALILEDDNTYNDGKGRGYYIDYVINRSSIRQWSLSTLAEYGYDAETGIWLECPGYSMGVLGDYVSFCRTIATHLNYDLTKRIPVIKKAVKAAPQYLFPDRMVLGFGDTHPSAINAGIYTQMLEQARQFGDKEAEKEYTALAKLFNPGIATDAVQAKKNVRVDIASFFTDKPLTVDKKIPTAGIDDYVTPTFFAPNACWLVQRNGMDRERSLMIALNASEGNHMHANGINMELYGKGYRLAPDAGIGYSLYSGQDYLEYYSQFPSHNTVCVDGISSYPVMKSNHSFEVLNCYPTPGRKVAYQPVSYSEVYFLEPESHADQNRMMSIVTTGESTGYYVDIFRSKKVKGGDKTHDYFYHNMGQHMTLSAADGNSLDLQPTQELAFAGAHLYAYSYIFDKECAMTDKDIKATYTIDMPDSNDVTMNMWLKGETDRKVFKALSPSTEGLSRVSNMPYNIKEQPTLTFVARQYGEAWNRPFVAIYEPTTEQEPSNISSVSFPIVESRSQSAVAICVAQKSGRTDYIISNDNAREMATINDFSTKAVYALWGTEGDNTTIFLGGGTYLKTPMITITAEKPIDVTIEKSKEGLTYTATGKCDIFINGKKVNR
ncbi:MAG: heparinase II/III family protein [Coprobacter sp.]|nr:heparinase II/III family protein [Coprobacter sp.]